MSLRTYRKTIFYTIAGLLGIAVLAVLTLMGLGSDCRGEACGWLFLLALMWVFLVKVPVIAALLLAGLAVCSIYRFRDIGLNGLLGLVPAFLLPPVINFAIAVVASPTIVFMPTSLALDVISIVCLGVCLWLLLFKSGSYLTESRRAHAVIYRVTLWSCGAFAILGIPSTIGSFARLFEQSLFLTSEISVIVFGVSPMTYYLYAASKVAIAAGLLMMVVRRPRTCARTDLPVR